MKEGVTLPARWVGVKDGTLEAWLVDWKVVLWVVYWVEHLVACSAVRLAVVMAYDWADR